MSGALVERMLTEYAAGATYREIAANHGLLYDRVRMTLKQHAPARRTGPREMDVSTDLIVRLREVDGFSWARIGREVGMSKEGALARYRRVKGMTRYPPRAEV